MTKCVYNSAIRNRPEGREREFLSLLDPERVTWFVGDEDTCLALALIDHLLRLLETQEAPEVARSEYYN